MSTHHASHDHPHEQQGDADGKHGHEHDGHDGHPHGHNGPGHSHPEGVKGFFYGLFVPHTHDAADSIDDALEASTQGVRALKISLFLLLGTTILQFVIFLVSGSVALFADTIHNFSDALTAVPLWIAFILGRRLATRHYTYGFGRAEDLAGLFIVAVVAPSADCFTPNPCTTCGSSPWPVAVVLGAVGVMLGFPLADPIIGIIISAAIIILLWGTVKSIGRRLMDGIEPDLLDRARHALEDTPGVLSVPRIQLRWLGHRLQGAATVHVTDAPLSTVEQIHSVLSPTLVIPGSAVGSFQRHWWANGGVVISTVV